MGEATVKTLASRLSSGLRQYGVAISLCLFALILYLVWQYHASIGWSYIWVMFIGGAVGAIELLGRYLYAPLRAISTTSGWIYILVNVGAAAAAYYMIGPNGFDIFPASKAAAATEAASLSDLKSILLAGFGALAFMRSSLFKFRVGDNEIGIGPAAILDTLLMVADRGVDRQEAIWRAGGHRCAGPGSETPPRASIFSRPIVWR